MRHFLVAIVLVAAASPAAAQPEPWAPERMTAGWVFTPSVAIGGLWDSNVTVRNEGVPREAQFGGLFNPRGEIDFNGRRAKFNAGYSGTLEAYRDLSELTRYEQRGRLDARYQMTPRLLFETRQQLTLTPTTDQLDLGGLPFTRIGSQMITSIGGFKLDLSQRTQLDANYEFQWVTFERTPRSPTEFVFLQGGHAHSPSAEITYALAKHVKVGGLYVYRHTIIDAGDQIFDTHRAQGTVEFELSEATKIRGRAGVDHLTLTDTEEARTGPSFGGGITHRLRQTILEAYYERAFVPSFGFGGLAASQTLHGGTQVPFAHGRVYVTAGFTYRRTDPVLTRGLLIRLDSYWGDSTVGYHVARWLRMEGFYSYTHQFSSAQGNVDRTRVGVQFVTSKPMRIQ